MKRRSFLSTLYLCARVLEGRGRDITGRGGRFRSWSLGARLGARMCRGRARGIGPLKDGEAPSSMGKVSRVVEEEEVTSPTLL
jgi:hypothetical protein